MRMKSILQKNEGNVPAVQQWDVAAGITFREGDSALYGDQQMQA